MVRAGSTRPCPLTPDQWMQLARDFGLPVVLLGGFAYLFLTGRIVTKRELEKWISLYEREREDRIGAQKDVAEVASASARVAEQVERAVGVMTNPYEDRLQGRPRGRG